MIKHNTHSVSTGSSLFMDTVLTRAGGRMRGQGGLSSRPSREEMRDALQLCVGTDEAERMFERQIAAMASLQHKVADQVEGERDVREQALGELRNAVTDEVGAVKAELEAQVHAQLPPGGEQSCWRACPYDQPACPTRGAPPAAPARQFHFNLLLLFLRR